MEEIKTKLQYILEISKCNNKTEIMKQPDLKYAHIFCKINKLNGQVSGALIEYYIQQKYQMIKNKSSLCIGDLQHKNINIEIKMSNGGKNNNKFNYVQLRINHDCEYILTAYYINNKNLEIMGELFLFRLDKNNLKQIIIKYGQYAHGTKEKLGVITEYSINEHGNNKEYALRPKYGDKCWCELLQFRMNEIDI